MELEVLVATMHQKDFSLVEKMNLHQNAVIANQCCEWSYAEQHYESSRVKMISTSTKGVGVNRNIAVQLANADILLFADDDITYYDGTLQPVIDAFQQLPEADVIFFGIDYTRNGQIFDKRRNKVRRLHQWNSLKYGACRMAIRRQALEKNRLSFSTLFGGGCMYCGGEDTIFICDCLRAGLRVYSHDYVLGTCTKDSSTWFDGFNDKYFFDRGALIACTFPQSMHLIKWYYILKLHKRSGIPISRIRFEINKGIRAFPSLMPYQPSETDD